MTLLPSHTETVCALQACDRLVGTDRWSDWPAPVRALPKLGGLDDLDVEALVRLRPDVVIAARSHRALARLRALGVAGSARAFFAPELPLVREFVSGFDVKPWHGLMAPAGTPPAIVNKLSEEIQAFLRTPAAQTKLQEKGIVRVGNSAAEFQAFMASEFELYKKVIQEAGIKAE